MEYGLTIEDVRAALKFAGELVDQEQHYPPAGLKRADALPGGRQSSALGGADVAAAGARPWMSVTSAWAVSRTTLLPRMRGAIGGR